MFAGDLAAKDIKVIDPEKVGLSSERLLRIDKAMQDEIDPEEDLVAIFFTQYMPSDMKLTSRFQTLVYQSIID